MNKELVIRHQINRLGRRVVITDGDWTSVPHKAIVEPLWRHKSSNFEPKFRELGNILNEYYAYICDSSHDITALSDDAIVWIDSNAYELKHKDSVKCGDSVLYYNGILRRLRGYEDEA